MSAKQPPKPKNPIWEMFTAGMDGKWSKRILMVMTPIFIGLLIARPFVDEVADKRIKLKTQYEEEQHQKEREERLRKLRESNNPYIAAAAENIEERRKLGTQAPPSKQ